MVIKKTFHLLVVDDNPTNLELMARIIEGHLPEVRSYPARSAEEGLRLVETERIDGAFVDVQMPHVTGFEMCRRLKRNPATTHIPVVLLTAHVATPQSRAEGLDAGAQDFISQPVSNIEMLARIRVMLRLQRERDSLAQENRQLHQQLESNIAALRWLTGLLDAGNDATLEPPLVAQLTAALDGAQEPTPDQFANLLLPKLPGNWQQGLLKLALLEIIPLGLARHLNVFEDVEQVLDYLWRHNFHLEKSPAGFCFREPLHGYLRAQARALLNAEQRCEVFRLAADWSQEQGDFWIALKYLLHGQLFEEAELLFSQTGLLLPLTAPKKVEALLELVPETLAVKRGWFSLFVGSCKFFLAAAEVDNWLELAKMRFVASGDRRGELLALTQQVRQHLLLDGYFALGKELLPRIEELLEQQKESLDPINQALTLFSLALGCGFFSGDLPRGEEFVRHGLQLAQRSGHSQLELQGRIVCGYLALLQGNGVIACSEVEHAWQLVATGVEASIYLYLLSTELLLRSGDLAGYRERCRQLVERFGCRALQQGPLGVHLCLLNVEASLLSENREVASEMLCIGSSESVAAGNPHLRSRLLQYRALLKARGGDRAEALGDMKNSHHLREEAGGSFHLLVNLQIYAETLMELDDLEQAHRFLQHALLLSCTSGELLVRPGIHAMLAYLYQRQAETSKALEQLEEMLRLLRHQHKSCFFLLPFLQENLQLAVENGVHPEIARRLSVEYLDSDIRDDGEFVPLLQVFLLGSFRLRIADGPWIEGSSLGSQGRHLFGLLIMAAGQQLPITTLCGRIWPENSAARARQNFDSIMLRLRKLFDETYGPGSGRSYLAVERGNLSLRHAKVDAIAYNLHVIRGRTLLRRGDLWQACTQLLAAERLWQGKLWAGFDLPGDCFDQQEIFDELRFEQIELLAGLGEPFYCDDDVETLLKQGLRDDPIRESMIKPLLRLYHRQKNQVQQKKLLNRYRKSLQEEDFSACEIEEIISSLASENLLVSSQTA